MTFPDCGCGKKAEYNERFDAFYCFDCNRWMLNAGLSDDAPLQPRELFNEQ